MRPTPSQRRGAFPKPGLPVDFRLFNDHHKQGELSDAEDELSRTRFWGGKLFAVVGILQAIDGLVVVELEGQPKGRSRCQWKQIGGVSGRRVGPKEKILITSGFASSQIWQELAKRTLRSEMALGWEKTSVDAVAVAGAFLDRQKLYRNRLVAIGPRDPERLNPARWHVPR
jgi:hypothetical protein